MRTVQNYKGDKTMLAEAIYSSGFNPICVKEESKLAHEKLDDWLAQELEVYSFGAAKGQKPKRLRLLAKRVVKYRNYGV